MNRQMQYMMRGVTLATLLVITLNAIQYFGSNRLKIDSDSSTENQKHDTVFTITNLKGQALFNEKCTSCHMYRKHIDGPSIIGFDKRTPNQKILYDFIRNPYNVIQSGDPYYNGLYKEYGVLMTPFPELTDQQISDILDYMKQAEKVYGR